MCWILAEDKTCRKVDLQEEGWCLKRKSNMQHTADQISEASALSNRATRWKTVYLHIARDPRCDNFVTWGKKLIALVNYYYTVKIHDKLDNTIVHSHSAITKWTMISVYPLLRHIPSTCYTTCINHYWTLNNGLHISVVQLPCWLG